MELQIIPKKKDIPPFDPKAIKLQHITYYDRPYSEYEGEEITETVIAEVLRKIPSGLNIYLSLAPYGEDDWLEVNCNGEWLALGYCSGGGSDNYYSYNPDFAGSKEMSPLRSDGQSPIEQYLALKDIQTGMKAVEYFIRTGELYPGIDWVKQK